MREAAFQSSVFSASGRYLVTVMSSRVTKSMDAVPLRRSPSEGFLNGDHKTGERERGDEHGDPPPGR